MPIRLWKQALNQFVILFPGRLIGNLPVGPAATNIMI
jgi:hypothetical protein